MPKLTINTEFNTSVPNFVYKPGLWGDGTKGVSAYYVLIYALLIDKVTETYNATDGTVVGVVLGGTPVSFSDISEVLGCSYSTVQRATDYLHGNGLIAREMVNRIEGYRYYVLSCRKVFTDKDTVTHSGNKYTRADKLGASSFNIEGDDDEFI